MADGLSRVLDARWVASHCQNTATVPPTPVVQRALALPPRLKEINTAGRLSGSESTMASTWFTCFKGLGLGHSYSAGSAGFGFKPLRVQMGSVCRSWGYEVVRPGSCNW